MTDVRRSNRMFNDAALTKGIQRPATPIIRREGVLHKRATAFRRLSRVAGWALPFKY